jgi:predicted lipoprotein
MRPASGFLSLAALMLCLAGASASHARTIGEKAVESHIRPVYQQLATVMDGLSRATATYCEAAKGDPKALGAAFTEAVRAWAGAEHLRFGPVAEDNRYERFAFYPDPKGVGAKQVASALKERDAGVTSIETLRQKSVALQGLTAYEMLFRGADADKSMAAGPSREFACSFAKAIAGNLAQVSAAVRDAWASNDGFAANLIAPGPDKLYRDDKEVTLELFKAFRSGLLQTRSVKLNRVLMGNSSEAQPRRAAFWRSGNAITVITANVDAIRDLYEKAGLYELVRKQGEGIERATSDQFHLIDEALAKLAGKPIAEITASQDSWEKLNSVVFGLINVQVTGGNAIAAAAELPMSFNALDGD